jgi:hypothetical protein
MIYAATTSGRSVRIEVVGGWRSEWQQGAQTNDRRTGVELQLSADSRQDHSRALLIFTAGGLVCPQTSSTENQSEPEQCYAMDKF